MKLLVIPDVHGRSFWKPAADAHPDCDRIIFLGDYLDPYGFEGFSPDVTIENFSAILEFASSNLKVVMLLGNHDLPYYSEQYLSMFAYHSRIDRLNCHVYQRMFKEHRHLFKLAHVEDDILFTHAGCITSWVNQAFNNYANQADFTIDGLCQRLNGLLKPNEIHWLRMVSQYRGGPYKHSSCVWSDVREMIEEQDKLTRDYSASTSQLRNVKQVFGHTIQARQTDGEVMYGPAIEGHNFKMLDTAQAYVLDTATFTATVVS